MVDPGIYTDIDNNLHHIFEQNGVPLNYSRTTVEQMFGHFDILKLPDYENLEVRPHIGYIFISRPNLNIDTVNTTDTDNGVNNYNVMLSAPRSAAFLRDPIGKYMAHSLSRYNSSMWLPIFTMRSNNYTVNDIQSVDATDIGKTFYGHSMPYASSNSTYKHGGSVTLEFFNDKYYSILWTCYLWMCYMYTVSYDDTIKPAIIDQHCGIIDYAASLYYLAVSIDNREILYWEKLIGLIPVMAPFSIFSWDGNPKLDNTVSIEFKYGMRSEPRDPSVLYQINALSCDTQTMAKIAMEHGVEAIGGKEHLSLGGKYHNSVYAKAPIIHAKHIGDSMDTRFNWKYYLEWLT